MRVKPTVAARVDEDEVSDLAVRWQKGDQAAAARLYGACHEELLSRMSCYAVGDTDAEDLAHDVWLKLHRSIDLYNTSLPFWPWMGRIAKNHGIDVLRRRGIRVEEIAEPTLLETTPTHESDLAHQLDQRSVIRAALEQLPERQRDVVVSVLWLDEPQSEVACRLGLTNNALRQLLHRARRAMRMSLERAGVTVRDLCLAPALLIRPTWGRVVRWGTRDNSLIIQPIAVAVTAVALAAAVATVRATPDSGGERSSPAATPLAGPLTDGAADIPTHQPVAASGTTRRRIDRGHAARATDTRRSSAQETTPSLVDHPGVTLPDGTSITTGPESEPDYAYGVEADVTGDQVQVVGQESYGEDPTAEAADRQACDVFSWGVPGTYCYGKRAEPDRE